MKNRHLLLTALICMALCYVLTGCSNGGGTSGSGIVVVRGLVKTAIGDPLINAQIELLETGTTTFTDSEGLYALSLEHLVPQITLNIKSAEIDVNVDVAPLPPESDTVTVNVIVNEAQQTGEATLVDAEDVQFFKMRAFFTAGCNANFGPLEEDVIRQSNRMKNGTECTLKVVVHGDSKLLPDITVGLERLSCDSNIPPVVLSTSKTLPRPHEGIAQLSFNFYDNYNACEYRISAPYKDSLHRQQYIHIETLTKQEQP